MKLIEDREITNFRLDRCLNERLGYTSTLKRVLAMTDSLEMEAGYYEKIYNDCLEGNNIQVTEIVDLRYNVKRKNKWILGLGLGLIGSLSLNYLLIK